jgi:CRISPR-associated protein Cmr1
LAVVPNRGASAASSEHRRDIEEALGLMHRFGTLGGRSRNGWGSYSLEGLDLTPIGEQHLIDWCDALQHDWPCGLGKDESGGLLWQSRDAYASWEEAIVQLAQTRAEANRSGGERSLLSYPVTKQSRPGWNDQDRLPSSLRFKVVRDRGGGFRAQIAHFPCRPTDELCGRGRVGREALIETWRKVHVQLDGSRQLARVEIKGWAP